MDYKFKLKGYSKKFGGVSIRAFKPDPPNEWSKSYMGSQPSYEMTFTLPNWNLGVGVQESKVTYGWFSDATDALTLFLRQNADLNEGNDNVEALALATGLIFLAKNEYEYPEFKQDIDPDFL